MPQILIPTFNRSVHRLLWLNNHIQLPPWHRYNCTSNLQKKSKTEVRFPPKSDVPSTFPTSHLIQPESWESSLMVFLPYLHLIHDQFPAFHFQNRSEADPPHCLHCCYPAAGQHQRGYCSPPLNCSPASSHPPPSLFQQSNPSDIST